MSKKQLFIQMIKGGIDSNLVTEAGFFFDRPKDTAGY